MLVSLVNGQNIHLKNALTNTWQGIKQRNIDPFEIKCVHRPYSETPNDCVSEGIGYGMLLALYQNDQEYFNMIWQSGEQYMWNGHNYDWRIDENGNKVATGAATDAEQDIALCLIFAQNLVHKGDWKMHDNPTYGERAQNILDNMWNSHMISTGKNVAPGPWWGGDDFVNPGYFAPAWYRIFNYFDTSHHDWYSVIDNCYKTIGGNVGFNNGLIPDWTTTNGQYYTSNLGYNTYGNGKYMFKDGIRTLWRISTDYLWHRDRRAKKFLENSYIFISSKGGVNASNFYQMNGDVIPKEDTWEFDGGQKTRHRQEYSPLTIGMWSCVPSALGTDDVSNYTQELLKFYENGTYWGLKNDTTGNNEDIEHNEMYFDQFLASFGAMFLNNSWIPIL